MSIVELPQTHTAMPNLPPTPTRPTGGAWSTDRTFDPDAVNRALNAATVEVIKDGATSELAEALTTIADRAEDNPDTAEAAQQLRSVLDATPEQAAGMRELLDTVGDDPQAAGRALELFEQARAAEGCDRLGGACRTHEDDHGTTVHKGAVHTTSGSFGTSLLEHQLVQWGDDARPTLNFVGDLDWPELDMPEVDALITATEKQLASLRDCRAALAAALGDVPTAPPKNQDAQQANTAGQVTA